MDIFSARLKWLREQKGLSQQQMADKLNLSQSYYGRFERNKGEPNLETLAKLPSILGESIDFMIGVTDFTQNATYIHNKLLDASNSVVLLRMDLEKIEVNPHDKEIYTKDFDPDDNESVMNKIARIKKALPLWENRMNIAREKTINLLREIPCVKDETITTVQNEMGWCFIYDENTKAMNEQKDPQ